MSADSRDSLLAEFDGSVCPACHHHAHDPGSCPACPRCELHTDEALAFVLRIEPELIDRLVRNIEAATHPVTASLVGADLDTSDCPRCGEWRDGPDADCADCGYPWIDPGWIDPGPVSGARAAAVCPDHGPGCDCVTAILARCNFDCDTCRATQDAIRAALAASLVGADLDVPTVEPKS